MKDYFIRDELQPMWNHSEPNTSSGRWSGGVVWQGHQMVLDFSWEACTWMGFGWEAHLLVGWHIIWLGGTYWNGFWLGNMYLSRFWLGGVYTTCEMTMQDTRWLCETQDNLEPPMGFVESSRGERERECETQNMKWLCEMLGVRWVWATNVVFHNLIFNFSFTYKFIVIFNVFVLYYHCCRCTILLTTV